MTRGAYGALFAAAVIGCGGGSGGSQGNGTCNPGQTATIGISATGVSPKAVCVQPGGTVTFVNGDMVAHGIAAGAPCPELTVASIGAGQSETVQLPTTATCTYDADAAHPGSAAFQGTIAVTTTPGTGPGY
jgi:plastocyanin